MKSPERRAMDGEIDAEEYMRITDLEFAEPLHYRHHVRTAAEKAAHSAFMNEYHAKRRAKLS